MDLTLDLFGMIGGPQLTLFARCLTLSRMINCDRSVKWGTGDCGEDSESWIHYSVPKEKGR